MLTIVLLSCLLVANGYGAQFEIVNKESGQIWVGIQGNTGKPALEGGGFELAGGQTRVIDAPHGWSGRLWARTFCDAQSKHCLTGDCGNRLQCGGNGGAPPVSLVELTLNGDIGKDVYDLSLVDGYNLAISCEPIGGNGDGSQYSCKKAQCSGIRKVCPQELQQNSQQGLLACLSACTKFNTDEYCCRGAHNTLATCKSSDWPKDYPSIFKKQCPDAYSYAYDDHKSTFTCNASKYRIVFGGDD